jgi:transglutaminase superfamily protein
MASHPSSGFRSAGILRARTAAKRLRKFAHRLRGVDVPTLRAAWWTARALLRTRRQLPDSRVGGVRVAPPPALPRTAERGVQAVLRRVPNTCLERALVLQQWLLSQGDRRQVVVGVTSAEGFQAHAWLEGEAPPEAFKELLRLDVDGVTEL